MSKKIHRNSICPLCNSGLKYKMCCGKGTPIHPNMSMFVSEPKIFPSNFEKETLENTGFYPDDFINPVKSISDVIYVILDESYFKNYYSVSGIVVLKNKIENDYNIQHELHKLVEKYNIDYIHFTEIFGRDNILKENKSSFLNEYATIVRKLDMIPFAVCMTKEEIIEWTQSSDMTNEQCYIALTWKLMFNILVYCIWKFGVNIIIELWRENENVTIEKRYLHQINCIDIIKQFPFANISIYKDYLLFMKTQILFSSLSDLVAYTTTKIFSKIDNNIPLSKIYKNNKELLVLFKKVFKDSTYMRNNKISELLDSFD